MEVFTTIKVGNCLLRHRLKKADMSQRKLSEITGISEQHISAYANNHRIMKLHNARAISKAIGCRIEDLYEWIELDKGQS